MLRVIVASPETTPRPPQRRTKDIAPGTLFKGRLSVAPHSQTTISGVFLACRTFGNNIDGIDVEVCIIQLSGFHPHALGTPWLKDVPVYEYQEIDGTLNL